MVFAVYTNIYNIYLGGKIDTNQDLITYDLQANNIHQNICLNLTIPTTYF